MTRWLLLPLPLDLIHLKTSLKNGWLAIHLSSSAELSGSSQLFQR
jgi:hypothetical protein